jgi:hypothetical protein
MINVSSAPGRPCIVQMKTNITKVKHYLGQKKRVLTRRLAAEMNISNRGYGSGEIK